MRKFKEGNNHQELGNRRHNSPKEELQMFLKLEIIYVQIICWGVKETKTNDIYCKHIFLGVSGVTMNQATLFFHRVN